MISDFFSLFFPHLCAACRRVLYRGETQLCLNCVYHLPETGFHQTEGNPLEQKFWGRVHGIRASAYYHFSRGEKVQRIIHEIKYKGNQDLAFFLGKMYGLKLKNQPPFSDSIMVVPVPLHADRKQQRGFNQSEVFGQGLGESMGIPCIEILERKLASETQTRKTREKRWENVKDIFSINSGIPKNRTGSLLLVDDVVTTGATLEACARVLKQETGCSINIGALAFSS